MYLPDELTAPVRQPVILIVDDEPGTIAVLAGALEELYETLCATSGPHALDLVIRQLL